MPAEKIFSISELTRTVRTLLETELGQVWVEGEISNYRLQSSGHQYFTLKDESAQLNCVLFKGNARSVSVRLEEGAQVQAFGEITVYEARGQYQLIIRTIQAKGVGALQAKFEALKRKLDAEGLFDRAAKKSIPAFPHTIAIVTSPTGAALRDMLNILRRRAPWVRLLIFPVRVQGKGAEKEIADAITQLNAAAGKTLPSIDTLVVGRGGGSIEDLWNFNEEIVARAIHASKIPVVSAVGHEIDFTIADFTADLRAPTPSAAAELVVPDIAELRQRIRKLHALISQETLATVRHHHRVLDLISKGALDREPHRVLRESRQQLDYLAESLSAGAAAIIDQSRIRAHNTARILAMARPDRALDRRRQHLNLITENLTASTRRRIERCSLDLQSIAGLLRTLGPETTFARGFSVTLDKDGNPLTSARHVKKGHHIHTRLAEGQIESTVDSTSTP